MFSAGQVVVCSSVHVEWGHVMHMRCTSGACLPAYCVSILLQWHMRACAGKVLLLCISFTTGGRGDKKLRLPPPQPGMAGGSRQPNPAMPQGALAPTAGAEAETLASLRDSSYIPLVGIVDCLITAGWLSLLPASTTANIHQHQQKNVNEKIPSEV